MSLLAKTSILVDLFSSLAPRTKLLLCLWALFFILVASGVHGSSTGVTAAWWAPEKPHSGYLFDIPKRLNDPSSRIETASPDSLLMRNARTIRWDELVVFSPFALSQLSHKPRFPVVNTNIGEGQNMLIVPHAPVLHIVTLARPATWATSSLEHNAVWRGIGGFSRLHALPCSSCCLLKTLGARYLLLVGEAQQVVPAEKFHPVSESAKGNFSIFEFPDGAR